MTPTVQVQLHYNCCGFTLMHCVCCQCACEGLGNLLRMRSRRLRIYVQLVADGVRSVSIRLLFRTGARPREELMVGERHQVTMQ
jgi:hypothetical protein